MYSFPLCMLLTCLVSVPSFWGFWAHKRINRLAVFTLPPEMSRFFKTHIDYLTENAVAPDRRRYAVVGEAERHFIDLDTYAPGALPPDWDEAVQKFGEDSLRKHGIAPWHIQRNVRQLTEAFRVRHTARILRLAADLGHYVADVHVPLHTTRNYNGQLTGQEGIHGFWESRLPELYAEGYTFWTGPAGYLELPAQSVWEAVFRTHQACDSVFRYEAALTRQFGGHRKFVYETRGNLLVKTYSREFAEAFHKQLRGQVERQMKAAVKMIGDLWYTCWVDAGQPDLNTLTGTPADEPILPAGIPEAAPSEFREIRPEPENG